MEFWLRDNEIPLPRTSDFICYWVFKGEDSNLNDDDYHGLDGCIFLRLWYGEKQGIPQNFNVT